MKTLLTICAFFTASWLYGQLPPSVAEQLCRPLFSGVQPKANAKTQTAVVMSIKMRVKDDLEAMDDTQIRNLVIGAYTSAGYKEEEYEQWLEMPPMVFRPLAIGAAMQVADDDVLHWSGTDNPFADEQPPLEQTAKYGNQHPHYDPKKPFWQESTWAANNFKEPNSVFTFDYTMRMQLIAPQGSYDLSLYINSKDGSMGLNSRDAAWLAGRFTEGEQVDFVVLDKMGRGIIFSSSGQDKTAKLQELRPRMLAATLGQLDTEAASNERIIREMGKWEQLEHISELDARYPNRYKCFEGAIPGDENLTSLCFHSEDADLTTMMPNLGMGVGVFKDYVNERNRLVVRRKLRNKAFTIVFQLESFDKKSYEFDGKGYEVFMGTEENQDKARQLKKELEDLQRRRSQLKDQSDRLSESMAGCQNETCRRPYKQQIAGVSRQIARLDEEIREIEAALDGVFRRRN